MNDLPSSRKRLGSWGLVGVILAAVVVWMATGMFGGDEHASATEAPVKAAAKQFTVGVRKQVAEAVERRVQINGDTLPDQVINIASQVEGQVVEVGPRKGARVAKGDLLVRVDARDAQAQLARATAQLRTRDLEYHGALKLRKTGYVSATDLSGRLAALEFARADLKDAQMRLSNLSIEAPVDGILENRMVEVGDYAKSGQPVATLIKIDPLVVSGAVSENDIAWIKPGAEASAEVRGKTLAGHVRFVSSMADPKTRTFTVEVAVDNPDSAIPAGLSARVTLPVEHIDAQRIPTSLLSLADDGTLAVKYVVDGKVVSARAEIVRAEGDAVFVSGLPSQVMLITRGQGFVADGEAVTVELEKPAAAAAK
jgi:multidrug efflux system membrane fusion protein